MIIKRVTNLKLVLYLAIFSCIWLEISNLLVAGGSINKYPLLYRIGNPLFYLVTPCFYLFMRLKISASHALKKTDLLHFLPTLLYFIDMIPFYIKPLEYKIRLVRIITSDPRASIWFGTGWLPIPVHIHLITIQAIIYIVIQFYMLTIWRTRSNKDDQAFKRTYGFLLTLTVIQIIIYSGFFVVSYNLIAHDPLPLSVFKQASMLISLGTLIMAFFTYKHFSLMISDKDQLQPAPEIKSQRISESRRRREISNQAEIVEKLESAFIHKQLHKIKGLTIYDVASELDVSPKLLSMLINDIYKKRFNDFINDKRVDIVLQRLNNEDWKEFTLEGIASDAGFTSRITFYMYFKKKFGMTPTEYIKKKQAKS